MVPLSAALLVVPALAAGLVYADAYRRGLSTGRRLLWSGAVAVVSYTGFLGAYAFDGRLFRSYVALTGAEPVVSSPRQLLAWVVVLGLTVSAASVLAYGVGSRVGRAT